MTYFCVWSFGTCTIFVHLFHNAHLLTFVLQSESIKIMNINILTVCKSPHFKQQSSQHFTIGAGTAYTGLDLEATAKSSELFLNGSSRDLTRELHQSLNRKTYIQNQKVFKFKAIYQHKLLTAVHVFILFVAKPNLDIAVRLFLTPRKCRQTCHENLPGKVFNFSGRPLEMLYKQQMIR